MHEGGSDKIKHVIRSSSIQAGYSRSSYMLCYLTTSRVRCTWAGGGIIDEDILRDSPIADPPSYFELYTSSFKTMGGLDETAI